MTASRLKYVTRIGVGDMGGIADSPDSVRQAATGLLGRQSGQGQDWKHE